MKSEGISIILLIKILSIIQKVNADDHFAVDPSGYVVYCPCMGRKYLKKMSPKKSI